jgi:hypothetical protein
MSAQNNLKTLVTAFSALAALSGCGGSDDVASPGEAAFTAPPPVVAPPPAPPSAPPPSSGPAADCPAEFANVGTVLDEAGATLRVCQFPQLVTGGLVVPKRDGTIYSISGRTDVGQDQGGDVNSPLAGATRGVLTLEAGVRVFGSGGLDYIVVNRGSQLNVQGSATEPVVLTSRQDIEGSATIDSIGQWGGLVILGRGPINNCPGGVTPGTPGCEAQVEGTNAFYGGNGTADNSGSVRYLRVKHSGFQILPNNELNGITLAGVGSGTTMDHIQVHNSSDDGIELFGGTVNARYIVLTGNDDDSLDSDSGHSGALQFVLVVQRANGGDRMNEMSNAGGAVRTPVTNTKIANFTYVGRAGGGAGIIMNTAANIQYYNGVVTKAAGGTGAGASCLDHDDAPDTVGAFNSVFFSCPNAFDDDANGAAAARFAAGTDNTAAGTSTLAATFVNGANETAATPFATLPTISAFFTQVPYIGAVSDANDTWWQGWTCGLTASDPC